MWFESIHSPQFEASLELVKADGTRKCRACADGSKRSAPWLRAFGDTYASCIATPCMRLFFAVAAAQNYTITIADTSHAFQQSPAPAVPRYMEIDESYRDWYRNKYGTDIDPSRYVIPLECSLQGDPSAGFMWESHINKILIDELGFKNTTHERNLYRGVIDGQDIIVCRQVDDFACAAVDPRTAEKLIALINDRVTTESKGMGTVVARKGHHIMYNSIDLYQTRDYVKVACDTYIDRLLQTHGWSESANDEDASDASPITDDVAKTLYDVKGPVEESPEFRELRDKVGFSYRQLLGELMFAYVVARPDIGFAVCFLVRFSACPHEKHYDALKCVAKYLSRTKDWGIVYWRTKSVECFDRVDNECGRFIHGVCDERWDIIIHSMQCSDCCSPCTVCAPAVCWSEGGCCRETAPETRDWFRSRVSLMDARSGVRRVRH